MIGMWRKCLSRLTAVKISKAEFDDQEGIQREAPGEGDAGRDSRGSIADVPDLRVVTFGSHSSFRLKVRHEAAPNTATAFRSTAPAKANSIANLC
jgi:hypothetical protein